MRKKTYISKFATIISDSELNTGLNPIGGLVYGGKISRILLYFDLDGIVSRINDKTFANRLKMTHRLHLFNAGSLDFSNLHCVWESELDGRRKVRASSFDLIFFTIPKKWDNGKGYNYTTNSFDIDFYAKPCGNRQENQGHAVSKDGVNWYQARNGISWDEEGVYSNEFLEREYQKYDAGEESVIFNRQHFDIGNENIDIDITCLIDKMLDGEIENNGIGIAFAPFLESSESEYENYVGFMTDKNPTFYLPYLETTYDEEIIDARSHFYLGKKNKLYLYAEEDGNCVNLDEMPTCKIEGVDYEVKQATKGVYYVEVEFPFGSYRNNTMLYDTWSNIKLNGMAMDDVELDFTIRTNGGVSVGNTLSQQKTYSVSCYGIQEGEVVNRGDVRRVGVVARESYTKGQASTVGFLEYRVYVLDGEAEVVVCDWEKVNTGIDENFFIVDTDDLLPQRYYVDIRLKYGMNTIHKENVLMFDVVGQKTNIFA